ncbi:tetratricopeptide repeat protein [Aureimonas jatrophae]|uniref:Tetratricopeptide repeat-containing protein n=1 Tax=Aureimonas jatrophae TaxID=1166073 RepID=A0A1H0ESV1_9HYPH|nr:tetratricopeptide repeat protein [Aureimonas jatrophae]MBB3950332.1 tetratricopeptide (TPR) repeat protein [Aureimonas jatrophae]SDN85435.1 Tetratricopeptide repeat-containing protein [Aureimonas jatrophae]
MSILRGYFPESGEAQNVLEAANASLAEALAGGDLDERTASVVEHLKAGLTPRNILGLTEAHLDALVMQASQFMAYGQLEKARDILLQAHQLDPLYAKALFAIGTTYQMEGDLRRAAHFFMHFLALDATNGDGYLRLGECLMAAGELPEARDALGAAKAFALEGKGRPETVAQADRLLAVLDAPPPLS